MWDAACACKDAFAKGAVLQAKEVPRKSKNPLIREYILRSTQDP